MGGAAGIPVSEVLAYVALYRIEDDWERYRLCALISAMDNETLDLWNKKEAKA